MLPLIRPFAKADDDGIQVLKNLRADPLTSSETSATVDLSGDFIHRGAHFRVARTANYMIPLLIVSYRVGDFFSSERANFSGSRSPFIPWPAPKPAVPGSTTFFLFATRSELF